MTAAVVILENDSSHNRIMHRGMITASLYTPGATIAMHAKNKSTTCDYNEPQILYNCTAYLTLQV